MYIPRHSQRKFQCAYHLALALSKIFTHFCTGQSQYKQVHNKNTNFRAIFFGFFKNKSNGERFHGDSCVNQVGKELIGASEFIHSF